MVERFLYGVQILYTVQGAAMTNAIRGFQLRRATGALFRPVVLGDAVSTTAEALVEARPAHAGPRS
jgi:hypothetical protein